MDSIARSRSFLASEKSGYFSVIVSVFSESVIDTDDEAFVEARLSARDASAQAALHSKTKQIIKELNKSKTKCTKKILTLD